MESKADFVESTYFLCEKPCAEDMMDPMNSNLDG